MQRHRVCALAGVVFFVLPVVSALGQGAQQVSVETFYPRHAGAGRTTVINVAVPRGNEVQSAEISPPSGVTVAGITGNAGATDQAIGWWELTLDVAKDAAPGDRSLVLVLGNARRTAPVTISVPTHIPAISDLRITPQSNQRGLELQLSADDAAGDLGESPYVWFYADCGGGEPIVGALPGKVNARIVRALFPDLRSTAPDSASANASCSLQVRLTDKTGIESNTLKATLELRN
jgi:hypothetical protein